MPTHSKARSSSEAAGGGGAAKKKKNVVATGSRNAITGQKLGKAARRGILKNAEAVEDILDACEHKNPYAELARLALSVARVVRTTGCGRVAVLLQSGEEASLPIAGSIKFKGGAGKKAGNSNCMMTGDMIVVRGAYAAGRLSTGAATMISEAYAGLGIEVPAGFFTTTAAAAEADDDVYQFDRTEEVEAEKAELSAMRAEFARSKSLRLATVPETDELNIDAI